MTDLTFHALTKSHGTGLRASLAGLLETIALWRRRAHERAELARFTDRELHDLALSAADAEYEIRKPVWRD